MYCKYILPSPVIKSHHDDVLSHTLDVGNIHDELFQVQ
jgi:hypothetical protein